MKPIRTEKDYNNYLKRIDALMDMPETQETLDELEILSILAEKYEEEQFPINTPDPVEAIKFRMEQMGLSNSDIAPSLGGHNRVSEVLKGKRGLSINMIRNLHRNFNIPYESLIGA